MKPLKKTDWFVFGDWPNVFWRHGCFVDGLALTIHDWLGYGLSQFVAEWDGKSLRLYFSRKEWTDIGARYCQQVVRDPRRLQKLLT